MVQLDDCLNHTAVNIIPGGLFTGADLFQIPNRRLGGAFFQKLVNIAVQNIHGITLLFII